IEQINKWETNAIKKVRETAEEARQQVNKLINTQTEKVSKKLNDLAERLRKARIDDDYVETDLQIWTIKLDKWKRYISAVSYSIHINEDPTNVLIAKMYISSTIQQLDFEQRFGEVFGDINIEDNGRVIKHGTSECGNAYARTIGKYSQGKHKVQFIINKKNCTVCDIF
ncbi:unnamed protein product, partial [Rotaria sp. Silwood1]